MAVAWPAGINQDVMRNGFGEGFPDRVVRSENDTGPSKRRPRFTAAPSPYTYVLFLSGAELTLFRTFFDSSLAGGALSFNFTNPRTQLLQEFTFRRTPREVTVVGHDLYALTMELESRA